MVSFPCPWCAREVALGDDAEATVSLRCDACATLVDLAPPPPSEPTGTLSLAA